MAGVCVPRSSAGCKAAGKSLLVFKNDPDDDEKDKLTFKWIRGDETTLPELGSPASTTDYTLCIHAGALPESLSLTMSAGSDWQPIGSKGFGFTSDSGTPHGVRKATLKSGASGKAMAIVKAKGLNVPDDLVPDLPLPVTALIFNDANGTCFEATFDSGDVITNDGTRFKAKSQ